jgi:hypothetical protein
LSHPKLSNGHLATYWGIRRPYRGRPFIFHHVCPNRTRNNSTWRQWRRSTIWNKPKSYHRCTSHTPSDIRWTRAEIKAWQTKKAPKFPTIGAVQHWSLRRNYYKVGKRDECRFGITLWSVTKQCSHHGASYQFILSQDQVMKIWFLFMTASLGSLRICKVVFHATFFLIRQKLSKTKIKIVLIDSNFSPSPPTSPCWPHKIDAIRRRVNHDTNILKMAQRFTFHKYRKLFSFGIGLI